jgi:hypothetical protein
MVAIIASYYSVQPSANNGQVFDSYVPATQADNELN